MKKEIYSLMIGMCATLVTRLFGNWTPHMEILLICMIIDFLFGVCIALFFKNSPKTKTGAADSWEMFKGLCKKIGMFGIVAVAHQIDLTLGINYIMTMTLYGFIASEALSIVENAGIMGIIKSQVLINAINILKDKAEKIEY